MIEARVDPKKYKDWLGLVAELVAQGIRFNRPYADPSALPHLTFRYAVKEGIFYVRQAAA
jgi:hypothetical protein